MTKRCGFAMDFRFAVDLFTACCTTNLQQIA